MPSLQQGKPQASNSAAYTDQPPIVPSPSRGQAMKIDRRHFIAAVAAVATNASSSAQAYDKNRVSQHELDDAIRLHGMWLVARFN
jgi:hypothetical protein